jgi:hypothetical protein
MQSACIRKALARYSCRASAELSDASDLDNKVSSGLLGRPDDC